jgi:UDP-3-O-[3-hydroxymyristoyl] glucosamine N-acyltransferase
MKLKDFADIVKGTIIGNPDTEITGVSGIIDAVKGDITFVASPRFLKQVYESKASCIIVKNRIEDLSTDQLKVQNPYFAFAKAIEQFYPRTLFRPGISESAIIADSAVVSRSASVFPFAYISDNVSIGDGTVIMPGVFIGERTTLGNNCLIYPQVVIREHIKIGDRVTIHSGSVIGSDGFGYVFEDGEHHKIPQVGNVIIEDAVEIGANVSVDRATLGSTVIGRGSKIDNQVQIAHNVRIGEHSILVAQVAIGGSCEIGNYVTLAGQVGVADHTSVESGTVIGARSGIAGRVTKGAYAGSPAIPHKNWLRSQSLYAKLPELNRKIKELEERLKTLEKGDTV